MYSFYTLLSKKKSRFASGLYIYNINLIFELNNHTAIPFYLPEEKIRVAKIKSVIQHDVVFFCIYYFANIYIIFIAPKKKLIL
ncbi:hypothetical protein FPG59_01975 [Flavobacterium sp. FPG59]|nr:hypothetical protein FPG59_01975 [Flavobacterium sp. FPG59]